MLGTARALAELDAYVSLAETAALNDYHRPKYNEKCLEIEDGRHPVVKNCAFPNVLYPTTPSLLKARSSGSSPART